MTITYMCICVFLYISVDTYRCAKIYQAQVDSYPRRFALSSPTFLREEPRNLKWRAPVFSWDIFCWCYVMRDEGCLIGWCALFCCCFQLKELPCQSVAASTHDWWIGYTRHEVGSATLPPFFTFNPSEPHRDDHVADISGRFIITTWPQKKGHFGCQIPLLNHHHVRGDQPAGKGRYTSRPLVKMRVVQAQFRLAGQRGGFLSKKRTTEIISLDHWRSSYPKCYQKNEKHLYFPKKQEWQLEHQSFPLPHVNESWQKRQTIVNL